MTKIRKSRNEIFKKNLEESKQYNSIENIAKSNSNLLAQKKELLKDLDQDYFEDDITLPIKTIKPLEKSKLLNYHISVKLQEIQKTLTQNKFDIPPRSNLITKIHFRDDIKSIYNEIHQNEQKFQADFDYHQINFNKKISELEKMHQKIEMKKLQDFDLEILEDQTTKKESFTKNHKLKSGLNKLKLTKINSKTNKKTLDKEKLYYIVILMGLLLIWFIRR